MELVFRPWKCPEAKLEGNLAAKVAQDGLKKGQEGPRWRKIDPRWGRLSKPGGDMLGSPFLAILGPPGPSWAHLGPLSQPSCHPTSRLETSMAELLAPKANLASVAQHSTCPKHYYLHGFRRICYLPSSQHVTLNLTLQSSRN